MSDKLRILFLCTGNACRSQMAEGWARHLRGDQLEPYSAGIAPHGVDPRAVRVMAEAGVDISQQRSKHVDALRDTTFDVVVTVCDRARESCPVFPAGVLTLHAGFDDPPPLAAVARSEDEALAIYRRVRDEIRTFIKRLPAGWGLLPNRSSAGAPHGVRAQEERPPFDRRNPHGRENEPR